MNAGTRSGKEPLDQTRAVACVLVNQFATPGLGSIMCGRTISGIGQLALAVPGFVLLMFWMLMFFYRMMLAQLERPLPEHSAGWAGKWGLISFGAAWLWALFTSISLLLQVRREAQESARL